MDDEFVKMKKMQICTVPFLNLFKICLSILIKVKSFKGNKGGKLLVMFCTRIQIFQLLGVWLKYFFYDFVNCSVNMYVFLAQWALKHKVGTIHI